MPLSGLEDIQNVNGLELLPVNVMLTGVFFHVVLLVGFAFGTVDFGAVAEGEVELRLVVVEDGPTVLQALVTADGIVVGAVVDDEDEEKVRGPEIWEGAA